MAAPPRQIFSPSSFSELFSTWERFPYAVPYAGGTGLAWKQSKQLLELPQTLLSLDKINELGKITRTERYLEIGSMVNLNQIILLGKIVPDPLRLCLEQIASSHVRNAATIGGNICFPGKRMDAAAPLTALDAQFELRSAQSSRWTSGTRFFSLPGNTAINPNELLTRIRIPLDQWDYSVYQKITDISGNNINIVFMVKSPKNTISDMRILLSSDLMYRDKSDESLLIGKQLPLENREIAEFLSNWRNFLFNIPHIDDFTRDRAFNCIDSALSNLS